MVQPNVDKYFGLDPVLLDRLMFGEIKSLSFIDKDLVPEAWEVFFRTLRTSRLITLNLGGSRFGRDASRMLASALECCATLMSLDLADCALDDDAMALLARAMRTKGSIEHLSLSFNSIGARRAPSAPPPLSLAHISQLSFSRRSPGYVPPEQVPGPLPPA